MLCYLKSEREKESCDEENKWDKDKGNYHEGQEFEDGLGLPLGWVLGGLWRATTGERKA
jgi:hypothetical protein